MPTDAELRSLSAHLGGYDLDANDPGDVERYTALTKKVACLWSREGQDAGTQINASDGVFLGKSAADDEIWASLELSLSNSCLCDAPHRALVVLQSFSVRLSVAGVTFVVSDLTSMAEVEEWHAGIKGSTLEERYAFVYDVLVAEAQGNRD
jgi:hypothetical protein